MSARSGGTAVEQRNHGGAGPLLQLRARGSAVLGLGIGGCGMGGERRGKAGVFKGGDPDLGVRAPEGRPAGDLGVTSAAVARG